MFFFFIRFMSAYFNFARLVVEKFEKLQAKNKIIANHRMI